MDAIKVKLIGLSRGGGGNLQPNKDATPTEQTQIVQPDPGYDGLRQVTVDPIPDEYADVSNVDAGAGDVRVGKIIVGSDGETITGTMPPQKPEEVGHATPTEQAQTVTPTAGSVFSAVEVGAIPSEYADVSSVDATAADVRTGKIIVDAQGDTVTGVMEPQKPEQVKTATPTTSPQSVTPDTGYALSRVDVGAIPSEYADISDVTATAGTVLTGSDFVDASGTLVHGSCDYDADTSDATATAGQIEAGATAYVGGTKITGTMPIRTTDVEIDSLSPVPIPAGSYDGTVMARLADPTEVDAQYILQGHEILGVQGQAQAGMDTLGALVENALVNYETDAVGSFKMYQFSSKTALESITANGITGIGQNCFEDCTNLQSVSLDALTSLSVAAFQGCSSLTSVNFPALTTTPRQVFYGAPIESFVAPLLSAYNVYGAEGLFANATYKNTTLRELVFPSLASVPNNMLRNCEALEMVDFGASNVQLNGANPLNGSTAVKTVIIRRTTVAPLSASFFDTTPFASGGTGGTIYIPDALYNHLGDGTSLDYKAATNWSVIDAYGTITWAKIEGSQYEVTT